MVAVTLWHDPSSSVLGTGSLTLASTPASRTLSVCRSKDILGIPAAAEPKELVGPPEKVPIKIRYYTYSLRARGL